MTWSHPRWWGKVWIMIFVPDSNIWIKGLLRKNFPNPYTIYGALHSPTKTWKSSLTNPPTGYRIEFYIQQGFDETFFWSLHRAMECRPILVQHYCQYLKENNFCALHFVSKTNENYHFWIKTVTKIVIDG